MAAKDTILPFGGGADGKSPAYIPKGQKVSFVAAAMHRDRTAFGEDADDFRPDRWATVRQGWSYLPFNGGPRICPGQQFALTEVSYTIVRFLQTFGRIESRDSGPFVERLTMVMTSQNGVKVALFSS